MEIFWCPKNKLIMDLVMTYPNFNVDIVDSFKNIIGKWKFVFVFVYEGCYELKNGICILRFTYDRGDVSCTIRKNGEEGFGYSVSSVFRYLNPNSNIPIVKEVEEPRAQLMAIADVVENYFASILEGDFSWLSGYLESQVKLNKMISYVWRNVDSKTELYNKFRSGDESWIKDLENFLIDNNISL